MLCLPGFTPVMNVDHATGEIAGYVVRSLRNVPLLAQLCQVRQLAFADEALGQFRIHAVKAQNHRPLELRFAISVAVAKAAPQMAKRPGKQRVQRIQETRQRASRKTRGPQIPRQVRHRRGSGAGEQTPRKSANQLTREADAQAFAEARIAPETTHISIPKISLNKKPAIIESTKNSTIQFQSIHAK